jgi:DnaJ like chaperone protein
MISIGSLIGSMIGFKTGGIFGLFIGAFIGMQVESWVAQNIFGKPSKKTRVQQSYFNALFASMGKLAKADGVVSQNEVYRCEQVMKKMRLDKEQRKGAINLFNQGKQNNTDISPLLEQFYQSARYSFSLKQMFVEMLLEVVIADKSINQAEWQVLGNICRQIRFPEQLLIALIQMRGFNVHGHSGQANSSQGRQNQWTPPRQHKADSYRILGVQKTDSKVVIRRAYKKLMSQHHPDKLIAKGLPPEMIEIAKTKTQNIQAAWEDIKDLRGF